MIFGLIVVIALNGQILTNFYAMNSVEECREQKKVLLEASKNVLESYCVAVVAELKK